MSIPICFDSVTDWNQTNDQIAAQFKCHVRTVRNARRQKGLPRAPDRTIRTELKRKLPMINDKSWKTHTNQDIAYILHCSKSAVQVFRLKNNKPAFEGR